MFIECSIVMLSADEKAENKLQSDRKSLIIQNDKFFNPFKNEYYELYILSDEKIKKDDWFLDLLIKKPFKMGENAHVAIRFLQEMGKKITATTNNLALTLDQMKLTELYNSNNKFGRFLPQIPQSFIEKYVEEYNKGNIITNVIVEYENDKEYWAAINQFNPNAVDFKVYTLEEKEKYYGVMFDYYPVKLKINQKDNTINIELFSK